MKVEPFWRRRSRQAKSRAQPRDLDAPTAGASPLPKSPANPERTRPRNAVSLQHHERRCTICRHPLRREIEQEFLHWTSPKTIAEDYGLGKGNPSGLYRHARAVGLWEKRFSWVRDSLAPILDQASRLTATPAAAVAAARTIAQINAVGQWVEPADRVYVRDLLDRMTRDELELYAREGKLPDWFEKTVAASPGLLPEPGDDKGNPNG